MQETKETYNGWTNYETWNVKLWIDNESNIQEYWRDRASNWLAISQKDEFFSKKERATLDLMDELKEDYEGIIADHLENSKASASFIADLLNSALSQVNWHEISKSIIEENEGEQMPKKMFVLSTSEISYLISEARTAALKEACGMTLDLEKACIESTFKIIRKKLNLRSRAKK